MRDLRNSPKAHLFNGTAGLCDLVWQGDFGKGIVTGSGVYSEPGVNPWTLFGPLAAGVTSVDVNAIPQRQFRLGMVVSGDYETEWVFCRLNVTGGPVDLMPGMVWQVDENYTAILSTTANRALNVQNMVSMIFAPATATGFYFGWLARAGKLAVQAAAGSQATGQGETTATAGVAKFVTGAHTVGSATIAPASAVGASSSITFKADTVNGSPYLQNINSQVTLEGSQTGITDLTPGMVITGAGMPANAIIAAVDKLGPGGSYRITIGTNTAGNQSVAQNATATAGQVTLTVTSHVSTLWYWPTETTLN